jgi:hypothetical protein
MLLNDLKLQLTADAVLKAIAQFDTLGRDAFLKKYGFREAREYFLLHEGKQYDSKAIVGAAFGFLPQRSPLSPEEFSGGHATVQQILEGLGFKLVVQGEAGQERRPRRWALVASPDIYDIERAIASVTHDLWTTRKKDLRRGDSVLVWRAGGRDRRRGVVAFGLVETDPEELADDQNPFWLKSEPAPTTLRVSVRYIVPSGLPLWLGEHQAVLERLSVARARGGTVFSIAEEDWAAVVALAGAWPSTATLPIGSEVGEPYVGDGTATKATPRDPFEVDPDRVDRGNLAHAQTVHALATHLAALNIGSLVPTEGVPEYDLAWNIDGLVWVAEVKSITPANEEKQLRLGLGQVLRYRHLLEKGGHRVRAVLVAERQPSDPSWETTCAGVGVLLTWPSAFGAHLERRDGTVPEKVK